MTTTTMPSYHQSLFGPDDLFARCLKAAAIAGAVFALAVLVIPKREHAIVHVNELPSRFARLILEPPKPRPAAPVARPDAGKVAETAPAEVEPAPAPIAEAPPRIARREPPAVDPNAGRLGRERARTQVSGELAGTSKALSSALAGLSSSLASTQAVTPSAPGGGRERRVRAGRSGAELGSVGAGLAGGAGAADLGGSAMGGSSVSIGALAAGGGTSSGGGDPGAAAGMAGAGAATGDGAVGAPGVYRSNASLLAVIQKYAPGIHYCYTNELKHDPTLSGKIVFALIVSASGEVTEVTVVENSIHSPRLASCALAQIRDWRFPPVPRGSTSFQAPFVFTPPR